MSFRREKFIPKGGPDGGDGGKGGDVIISADRRYYNLSHFFKDRVYRAGNGKPGMGDKMYGKDGNDLIIFVPPGTLVYENDDLVADLDAEGKSAVVAKGGIGGKGNTFFKSATQQAPRFSQPGMPGEEKSLTLNLKLISDVGLVGLPNSGKSTLLSKITNAHPKIAEYPFTTLIPNLGVVERDDGSVYTVADIPGIIEGAHRGLGLGLSFLQHIERVKVILYLIDATVENPYENLELLKSELVHYNPVLVEKPHCVVLNKIDLLTEDQVSDKLKSINGEMIIPVSALKMTNLDKLMQYISTLMEEANAA